MSQILRVSVVSVIFVVAPPISSFARSSHSSSFGDDFGKILPIAVVLVVGLVIPTEIEGQIIYRAPQAGRESVHQLRPCHS